MKKEQKYIFCYNVIFFFALLAGGSRQGASTAQLRSYPTGGLWVSDFLQSSLPLRS